MALHQPSTFPITNVTVLIPSLLDRVSLKILVSPRGAQSHDIVEHNATPHTVNNVALITTEIAMTTGIVQLTIAVTLTAIANLKLLFSHVSLALLKVVDLKLTKTFLNIVKERLRLIITDRHW
jgi:hypothetical protein